MDERTQFLTAYDEQLRTRAETAGARAVTVHGPLWLVTLPGGHGFVTYRDLGGAGPAEIGGLVQDAVAHFREDPEVTQVEWKTRSHDVAPDLDRRLVEHGFAPEEAESIMVGAAANLAVDVPLPDGVTLRRVTEEHDLRAMTAMTAVVFDHGTAETEAMTETLLQRVADDSGTEVWVAEADGRVASAGRLEPVPDSDFAGIWGGSTLPEWRGRGIYRALTSARARSALRLGKTLVHSDSTEYSRPILERYGFLRVSTTTPYVWVRG